MRHTDIAIVGGGASGLTAAITAARHGAAVSVLEKLPRVGKKLLATGNGRCNLGNLSTDPAHYHGSLDPAPLWDHFPGEAAFFRALGVIVRPDEAGRLYPASGQATSILDALRLECQRLGVQEHCDCDIVDIRRGELRSPASPEPAPFHLHADSSDTIAAKRVILATGGRDGHALAQKLGHTVTDLRPALCPIPVDPGMVRPLKGLRVQARVTARRDDQPIAAEEGQVQFTEGALSGICVFNLATHRPDTLSLDLLPWCDDAEALLTELLTTRRDAPAEDLLTGLFPKRIGQALLKSATTAPALAALVKDWRFPVQERFTWEQAQVTAGGVTGIGPTLESPHVPGLYFAGELLDIHGDSGGFNLRFAWASGLTAGTQAARGLTP